MSSNRPNRANTNVRAIIANLGRSIDEARDRRLQPAKPEEPAQVARTEMRIGASETPASAAPTPAAPAPTAPPRPSGPPPLRAATEMFDAPGNRLKAKPKRAS